MHIDGWTLAIQTINVLVLVWLLSRFLYRPVMAAIAARQASARKIIAEAETARISAAADADEMRRRSEALEAEETQLRDKMRAEVAAERAALLKEAGEDAAKARAEAEAALRRDRDAARKALERDAENLAVRIAGRLVGRIPAEAAQEPLFEELLGQVRDLPEADRKRLASSPLELVSAKPSESAGDARLRDQLKEVLGAEAALRVRLDPALIAGFELRSPSLIIANSWRSDLERIAHELAASPAA